MSADPLHEWIFKAEEDYVAAIDLVRKWKKLPTDVVCFHCQQCAEKYLKAYLIRNKVIFRKTHDLRDLRRQCVEIEDTFDLITDSLMLLNQFAVDVRYPGEIATKEEAREAVAAMKTVRKFVRARLGLKTR